MLKDIFETARNSHHGDVEAAPRTMSRRESFCRRLVAAGGVLLGKTATVGISPWRTILGHTVLAGAQPVEPGAFTGGFLLRLRCGDKPAGFAPATLGSEHRRFDPRAGRGLRHRFLKPAYGLVSRRGVIPNCFSHDHAGPLAWTSEDLAILMQVIAGHDPKYRLRQGAGSGFTPRR